MAIELTLVNIRQNVSPPSSSSNQETKNHHEKEIITRLVNETIGHCGASSASAVPIPSSIPSCSLPSNSYSDFHHLDHITPTGTTTTTTTTTTISENVCLTPQESLSNSILRYVRVSDKYTSFCSVLLKSWAYHNLQQRLAPTPSHPDPPPPPLMKGTHSIVELPRTNAGKPYLPFQIPTISGVGHLFHAHVHPYPISISHQYPHVAIATSFPPPPTSKSTGPFGWLWLGQDIVQFESHAPSRLYATQEDFLNMFQQSFTPWEWDRICHCDLDGSSCRDGAMNVGSDGSSGSSGRTSLVSRFWRRSSQDAVWKPTKGLLDHNNSRTRRNRREEDEQLKEFYLRWSMKEAYTKALGLGMKLEFTSFETHLVGIDDCNRENVEVEYNSDGMIDCCGVSCRDIRSDGCDENGRDEDNERKQDNMVKNGDEDSFTNGIWEYVCQQIRDKQCHDDATLEDDQLSVQNRDNHESTHTTNTTSDHQYCQGWNYATVQGIIKRFDTPKGMEKRQKERMERWNFYFVPLSSSRDGNLGIESTGCVCVCASAVSSVEGHSSVDDGNGGSNCAGGDETRKDSFLDLAITSMTLDDLISFHGNGSGKKAPS